ncbi:MAG: DALR domain-containing protein, partial [Hyphomonas sp.]
ECSAMSAALLGPSFDIHGGGIDLQFPHHENEIAQSCCAHPDEGFARYWLHNEMLQVEGKKMSKSLGNFFTVRDLLEKGVAGEVIRLVFLETHYRKPMDWTDAKQLKAEARIVKWANIRRQALSDNRRVFTGAEADPDILAALADDLNTHAALTRLYEMEKEVLQAVQEPDSHKAIAFFDSLALLGFDRLDVHSAKRTSAVVSALADLQKIDTLVIDLIAARKAARAVRDFAKADFIRDGLAAAGIEVVDKADGPEWDFAANFDADKLADLARTHGT